MYVLLQPLADLIEQALMTLKETNRDCFFGVLNQNLTKYLPIVYTPTGKVFPRLCLLLPRQIALMFAPKWLCPAVGKACEEWSHLLQRPTGLYVSINDLVSLLASARLIVSHFSCCM